MKKTVILYHADCPDGFGAAWAAWTKFGSAADYIAIKHQEPLIQGLKNKAVYQLDITYFGKDLRRLLKANRVATIDHHEGALDAICSAHKYYYDKNHSGAVLSWKFFHPGKPVPMLLRYIEDRDIWKWRLPNARELLMTIDTEKFDFLRWTRLARRLESPAARKKIARDGTAILKYHERAVELLLERADKAVFLGKQVWVVNSPVLKDELGHTLSAKGPPITLIWSRKGNKIYVGLRSNGNVDVSGLAKRFGGNGHKASSGFVYDARKPLPWRYILE